MTRVAIVTADRVSSRMAGPAIRAWEMARYLARSHEVRLLVREEVLASGDDLAEVQPEGFELVPLAASDVARHAAWAEVVVVQGYVTQWYPELRRTSAVLVCDLYDPFHLESLEMTRTEPISQRLAVAGSEREVVNGQLLLGDTFLCASETQRDFWLGHLSALGRVGPHTYDADPTLRSLIDVVAFGIQADDPRPDRVLKGVVEGIDAQDEVILWGGGIYNWFDPLTVISAVDALRRDHPRIRLVFLGTRHPNPDVPQMRMALAAQELTRRLGLEGKHVFFNHDWVPYEQRGAWLLESDLGISCHLDHAETTYSFRTRVLDYVWARLPVVVTRGDAISRMVEERGLGLTVPPGDVAGWARALERLLTSQELARSCRAASSVVRDEFRWERVLAPLGRICDDPRRAPDLAHDRGARPSAPRLVRLMGRVGHHWEQGGFGVVVVHARNRLRRAIRRSV